MRAPPSYLSRLVGRRTELRAITDAVRSGARATLVGPAGVGKTRLAAEAARRLGPRVVFVDASAAVDADGLARALLRDLGAPGEPRAGERLDRAAGRELAASAPGVCVLDNLEQLGDSAADALRVIGEQAPEVPWIATSRAALELPRETVLEVRPLAVDADAVDLFLEALPPGGAVADREAVARIVARLDGLPLAIELAAGRAAVLSLDEIERRLDDPLALLADPARPADRTTRLERSIHWSWELLAPRDAVALAEAALFEAPFDAEAAAEVVGHPAALATLAGRHLLRLDGGRHRLYEAVRAYVRARHPAPAEARRRHAAYFGRVARRFETGELPFAAFDAVADDVLAAVDAGLAEEAGVEDAQRTLAASGRWFAVRATPAAQIARIDRAVAGGVRSGEALVLLRQLAAAHNGRGDFDAGERAARQLLAEAHGDRKLRFHALDALVTIAHMRQDLERAVALGEEKLALARELGDAEAEVYTLCGPLILRHWAAGDLDGVQARLAEALSASERAAPDAKDRVRQVLVELSVARSDADAARHHFAESLRLQAGYGPVTGARVAVTAYLETLVALATDDPEAVRIGRAALARVPDGAKGDVHAVVTLWVALAEAFAGLPEARDTVAIGLRRAAAGGVRTRRLATSTASMVAALLGDVVPTPEPDAEGPTSPRAFADLVVDCAHGRIGPDEAEAAAERIGPRTSGWPVLRRAVREVADRRRREALVWRFAADGSWFDPPSGPRVVLTGRVTLSRIVRALAAGGDLDVETLFAVGWPGERASAASRANRVRVAITTLRKAGLAPIAFVRGRGWSLPVPVAIDQPDEGAQRCQRHGSRNSRENASAPSGSGAGAPIHSARSTSGE